MVQILHGEGNVDSEAEFGVLFHRIISDRHNLPFHKSTREDEDDTSGKCPRQGENPFHLWKMAYRVIHVYELLRLSEIPRWYWQLSVRLFHNQELQNCFAVKTVQVSQFQPISALGHLWV